MARKYGLKKAKSESTPRALYLWPLFAVLIKFIISINLNGHIWLGADGESYLKGAQAIFDNGILAKDGVLQYWPAGYSLIIALLGKVFRSYALLSLGLIQSILFSFATYFFTSQLKRTKLSKFSAWISFLISFNPTLSLSSLVVGYESMVASLLMISLGVIFRTNFAKNNLRAIVIFSSANSLIAFVQPRYLLVSFALSVFWIYRIKNTESRLRLIVISLLLISVLPSLLIVRNHAAVGLNVISTNLGQTMNIGAGEHASGGYSGVGGGVKCRPDARTDNALVFCVTKWYLTNPAQFLRLAWNKSIYFWSPWSGPIANGTMARNPWLKMDPVVAFGKTESGQRLVYGSFGRVTSSMWVIANLFFLSLGLLTLFQASTESRHVAYLLAIPILVSWLTSIATIGDHRFRLPIIPFVIVCEVLGLERLLSFLQTRLK